MQTLNKSLIPFLLFASLAAADSAYVIVAPPIGDGQFGKIDLDTHAFTAIGLGVIPGQGFAPGPGGSLYTLAFNGELTTINPATGVQTVVGATGLTDCLVPGVSPCGPKSSGSFASVNGQLFATDFSGNLYKLNPANGASTLVGPTGIPALTFTPVVPKPDGTFDAFDEGLFGANGKLYATFDAFSLDPSTFTIASIISSPMLYEIDPATGVTTSIGPTDLNLGAVMAANGSYYGFNSNTGDIVSIDLATGGTTKVSSFDPAIGIVGGASAATPEPGPLAFVAAGLIACAVIKRRSQRQD